MTLDVRTIDPSEYPAWFQAVAANFFDAFGARDDAEREARRRAPYTDFGRVQGVFDDKRVVGTFLSFATELTVPGGAVVPADVIAAVTVTPIHRRRGLLTRMMEHDLRGARERGEAVAALAASEYPIYGRYGFGPAVESVDYALDTREARFARRDDAGTLELVDAETMRAEAPVLYERFRFTCPGAVVRDDGWWDQVLGVGDEPTPPSSPPLQHLLFRGADGTLEGYVSYCVDPVMEQHQPRAVLTVRQLCALTPRAYARLWRYCCEADLVRTVRAPDRPTEEPLPWLLTDARAVRTTGRVDLLWVRVLDAAAALAGRRYLAQGRVVVEVVDPAGYASGRYLLDGGPDGASCARTDVPADLTLPVQALGAVYLGGTTLRTLAAAGWVDEHRPGALARADAMLRSPVPPWCPITF